MENETGYPHTWGLPEGGKPRGSINSVKGDPLTPEWPSTGISVGYFSQNFKFLLVISLEKNNFVRGL